MTRKIQLLIFLTFMPLAAQPPSCDDVIGKWAWFTRGVVTIKQDGAMAHEPGNDGTWTCASGAKTIITLRWRVGGFVNTMELLADRKKLSSTRSLASNGDGDKDRSRDNLGKGPRLSPTRVHVPAGSAGFASNSGIWPRLDRRSRQSIPIVPRGPPAR